MSVRFFETKNKHICTTALLIVFPRSKLWLAFVLLTCLPVRSCSFVFVVLLFSCSSTSRLVDQLLERLGVTADHYELDWCGKGTDGRLDVPRSATWPLFVTGSGQSTKPEPFGYLRHESFAFFFFLHTVTNNGEVNFHISTVISRCLCAPTSIGFRLHCFDGDLVENWWINSL